MSHLSRRTVFAFTLLAAAAPTLDAAAAAPSPITVRVYDGTSGDASMREAAIREAAAILDDAGADAAWRDCTAGPHPRRCDPARGDGDLLVRILPTFVETAAATGHALQIRLGADRLILGFAVVDPVSSSGVLATIFMDRVEMLAQRTGVPIRIVLGRAIAHEVGHLLLGSGSHSPSGLMRAVWTDAELKADRREDWRLTMPRAR